ncbi:MAG: hypothetical protein ACRC20_09530 [Segniliparus sp.]|uniref:hypothetical protein n=1 Tax=Segniliparus sp. TaxID=2804064 RepID=UPI003F29FEC9
MTTFMAITALVLLGLLLWRRFGGKGQRAPGAEAQPALLTLTGVSPVSRPSGDAEAFCAVSGILRGPELPPTEVYQRWVLGPGAAWPSVGQEIDALYLPGKASTHWWAVES